MKKKKTTTTTRKSKGSKNVTAKRSANKRASRKTAKRPKQKSKARKIIPRKKSQSKKRKPKLACARKPIRKEAARKKPPVRPRAKPAKRVKRQTSEQREIAGLREQVRKLHQVVEDRKRERKSRERSGAEDDSGDGGGPIAVPKGAIDVKRDDDGNVISFELPSYAGDHFDEIDFDYDWDDIIDEYGDEEQDQYAEDAG